MNSEEIQRTQSYTTEVLHFLAGRKPPIEVKDSIAVLILAAWHVATRVSKDKTEAKKLVKTMVDRLPTK